MHSQTTAVKLTLAALAISGMFLATRAFAADIKGQVMGGGAPIAQSTVTLWAASSDAPKQLAQTKTDNEGRFEIRGASAQADASLYLVATGGEPGGKGGDNPAIALLAVVGSRPPAQCRHKRDDDSGIGCHPHAVHRRHGDQGLAAAAADCRGQRAQLCRSRNRRLWRDDSGCSQQRADTHDGQLRHAIQHSGSVRHAVEVRCLQQSLLCGDVSDRRLPKGHAGGR